MKRRRQFFFFFLLFFGAGQISGIHHTIRQFDSIFFETKEIAFTQGTKANSLVAELYRIAGERSEMKLLFIRAIYMESYVNSAQGFNDSTLVPRMESCFLLLNDEKNHLYEEALLNYSISSGYMTQGNYAEAFRMALRALELFNQLQDSTFSARSLILLGNICDDLKSYNMAEDYYNQARSYTAPGKKEYYKIMLNLYTRLSRDSSHLDAAIDSLLHFISLSDQYQNTELLAVAYLNLGACYATKGFHQQAFQCYNFLLDLIKTIDNKKLTIVLYQNLGMYYCNNNDLEKAAYYLYEAKKQAEKDENLMRLSFILSGLSYMYELKGNMDSAYHYLKEYNVLNVRLTNNAKAIEAYQSYVSILLESSQKELKIAGQELLLKNRRFTFTVVIAVAIMILMLLLLIIIQQKKRQQILIKKSENRNLSDRLEHEQKIQLLHEKQYQEIVASKIREITSYSLLISNKNNVLQQISKLILYPAKNKEELEKVNEQINQIIKTNLDTDRHWENFLMHFDKVHPRFFDKLRSHCTDLTEQNLRLCAYFRIGLSIKEVAQILNISPETSKTSRYRLKKKLGLSEEDNLDDFLRNL